MATATMYDTFTLNEERSRQILSTKRTVIRETNVFNDIKVNKTERIANAASILKSRKCK